MENSSDKSKELPSELIEYVRKYMTHYIPKRGIENFAPNNTKRTPIIDTSIKRLLIKSKKTLTLNHEDALISIHDKIAHVFRPSLKPWTVMKEEKQMAMHDKVSQYWGY